MKRLNSGQPDRQTERERERERESEREGGEKIQKIMIDELSNHFYSFFYFVVCLFAVCPYLCSKHRL